MAKNEFVYFFPMIPLDETQNLNKHASVAMSCFRFDIHVNKEKDKAEEEEKNLS